MLISKDHLRARHSASKDASRPVLQTIDIRREGDEVVAASTDGYTLIEVRQETPEDWEFPQGETRQAIEHIRITSDTAAKLKPMMKADKTLPILAYAQVTADGVVTSNLKRTTVFHDKPVEGNFPKYQDLIPGVTERTRVVTVNPVLLMNVLKAFEGVGSIKLRVEEGQLSPIVLTSSQDGTDITGVIMPVKDR